MPTMIKYHIHCGKGGKATLEVHKNKSFLWKGIAMENGFKIVAFACNKWGYGAADLTGTTRSKYPTDIRIVRVRCTGRIDAYHLLHSFRSGADAVMVISWHIGECDFSNGNIKALIRINFVKRVLDRIGLDGRRVNLYECGAAEFTRFLAAIGDTMDKLRKLGPNPLKN